MSWDRDVRPVVVGPPRATLADIGMSEDLFSLLVMHARAGSEAPAAALAEARDKLALMAPTELPPSPADWAGPPVEVVDDEVARWPAPDPDLTLPTWSELASTRDEAIWQQVFPFRVAGEAALRRLRLSDLPILYAGHTTRLAAALCKLAHCRRYIFVLNILLLELVSSFSVVDWFFTRGALASVNTFLGYSKAVTILLKASIYPDAYLPLVECGVLAGYRLLPDPAFEMVAATRAASQGFGLEHVTTDGLAAPFGWADCSCVLRAVPKALWRSGAPLSFPDFVRTPELWATAGSSSIGRLRYMADGRWKSVKARKLMLPYVTEAEVVIRLAEDAVSSTAVSLVKSELAKIRIAVAGDLGFYMVWAYLHYLYGDIYSQWPGISLGESTIEEGLRLEQLLAAAMSGWGFPADFESFDRQPQTSEIVTIGRALLTCARMAGPVPDWLASNAISGLADSTLSTPRQPDGYVHSFRVTNYLPSGIAITSAVGNAFNAVASESMIRLVEAWCSSDRSVWLVRIDLRGDDSSFITRTPVFGLLLSLAARALQYKHAPRKVALLDGASELLRVSFSRFGCRGYPARLIPSLTQRKPWSNDPWDPEGTIRSHWDTCCALERRRVSGLDLWRLLEQVWSTHRGLPAATLGVHPLDGGLGIGLAGANGHIVPALGGPSGGGIPASGGKWAHALLVRKAVTYGVRLDAAVAQKVVDVAAGMTLSTVDVPDAARVLQGEYRASIAAARYTIREPRVAGRATVAALEELGARLRGLDSCAEFDYACAQPQGWFGSLSALTDQLAFARQLRPHSVEVPLPVELTSQAAVIARRWRVPAAVAQDWLVGLAPRIPLGRLHPSLATRAARLVIYLAARASLTADIVALGFGQWLTLCGHTIGDAVSSSGLHRRIYSW